MKRIKLTEYNEMRRMEGRRKKKRRREVERFDVAKAVSKRVKIDIKDKKPTRRKTKASKTSDAATKATLSRPPAWWDDETDAAVVKKEMGAWIEAWNDMPLPLLRALHSCSFFFPTPIQVSVLIPGAVEKQDIVAAAETGSGKTLAFGIPIVAHISATSNISEAFPSSNNNSLISLNALILVPSRELAVQVESHIKRIVNPSSIRTGLVIGGISVQKQLRILDVQRPQIVVGTPGRLWSLMNGEIEPSKSQEIFYTSKHLLDLKSLQHLVLDEADRLVEVGHFKEIKYILRKIYGEINKKDQLQTFIFSATLTLPSHKLTSSTKKAKIDGTKAFNGHLDETNSSVTALLLHVKFRNKKVFTADLTSSASAPRTKGNDQGSIQTNEIKKKEKPHCDLKLPELLELLTVKCLETDIEFQLYAYLLHHFYSLANQTPPKRHSKVLVFVNAITYVYRLEPLLQVLFGSHPVLYRRNKPKIAAFLPQAHSFSGPAEGCGNYAVFTEDSGGQGLWIETSNRKGDVGRCEEIEQLEIRRSEKENANLKNAENSGGAALLKEFISSKIPPRNHLLSRTFKQPVEVGASSATELDMNKRNGRKIIKGTSTPKRKFVENSICIVGIHSKLKQSQRLKKIDRFKTSSANAILICTDVAARGLDLPEVDLVVHLQPPRTPSLFVHRSGRTARANRKGQCVCICCPSNSLSWDKIFDAIGKNIDSFDSMDVTQIMSNKQMICLRDQFRLAGEIESEVHKMAKKSQQVSWITKAAVDADLVCDELLEVNETDDTQMTIESNKTTSSLMAKKKALLQLKNSQAV